MLPILPTFLRANASARILVKRQHERTQAKPKRNRLRFRAALAFSQPPLPPLPTGLSLTRNGRRLRAEPNAAAPHGRMPVDRAWAAHSAWGPGRCSRHGPHHGGKGGQPGSAGWLAPGRLVRAANPPCFVAAARHDGGRGLRRPVKCLLLVSVAFSPNFCIAIVTPLIKTVIPIKARPLVFKNLFPGPRFTPLGHSDVGK